MNKNLYELMNWPDIEEIVYSECDNPKALLGGHVCNDGFLVQVFRPDAVTVSVNIDGKKKSYPMEKMDEAGFFATLVPGKKKCDYTLTFESLKGEKKTYTDPYGIPNVTREDDYKAFLSGASKDAHKIMGARLITHCKTKGCIFTVWAPNALRVSVVGDFNNWNGNINQMERIGNSGVFELFIPEIEAGAEYLYEVKMKGGSIALKLDPYGRAVTDGADKHSIVEAHEASYPWQDADWLKARKKDDKGAVSIYEVSLQAWANNSGKKKYADLAEDIVKYVKSAGYSHVLLMPVAEYFNDDYLGYTTVGYFSPTCRYGKPADFKNMVDIFHKEKIGVLMDWNAAYFGNDAKGLVYYDGQDEYGYLRPSLEKHPDWSVITFDYKKGAVKSFLMSSLSMWLDDYHIDGIRIDGVASMLYLDYGKAPGSWQTNMYGGNDNLDAIQFIKDMNAYLAKRKDGVITIAEESSGWLGVTKANEGDNLGFDYKIDNNWKNDFLSFISNDPLFRKGEYDKLVYSMLYRYSESYILGLTHDDFTGCDSSLFSKVSGDNDDARFADIRAALGYMFTFPGAKLITMGQDIGARNSWMIHKGYLDGCNDECYDGMKKYISELNSLYSKNNAMYEQDDYSDGFEWLENRNAEETVLAYTRISKNGSELTIVVNFTPVERTEYRLKVNKPGKYKEIFNSNIKKYGGKGKINSKFNNSDCDRLGDDEYIVVTLPASSVVVYEQQDYTDLEIKEIAIIKKANVAKKEAKEKVEEAERLAKEAVERALRALEAERIAKEAADDAVRAKEEAERKAAIAVEESRKIDVETQKLLDELRKENAKK